MRDSLATYKIEQFFLLLSWCWKFVSPAVQFCELQDCDPLELPTQSAPPFVGGGLLQRRVRDWVPPPQVALHVPHALHSPQFPAWVLIQSVLIKQCTIDDFGPFFLGRFMLFRIA